MEELALMFVLIYPNSTRCGGLDDEAERNLVVAVGLGNMSKYQLRCYYNSLLISNT